jgi:hypothetical protein
MTAPEVILQLVQRFNDHRTSYLAGKYNETLLELHKQSPRTPQEKEMLQREVESTDAQIDGLVYRLNGLTEAEIKIVEGGS